jgi:plasmid stabilization system protein ParE
MAKWKVVLSNSAQLDRLNILNYWFVNNKSAAYSRKLDAKFKEVFNNLQEYPLLGVSTNFPDVRAFVILNYKIFYQTKGNVILILRIWDTRQNPETLKL